MDPIPELADAYEILERIGEGSQGVVYHAVQRSLGREVVLKVSRAADQESRREFRREAEILAGVRHPNLVLLLDFGLLESLTYTAYPYVPGETLHERLRRTGPLGWREASRIAHEIAAALGHVHHLGILHRDVKPSNLWLPDDGPAQLMDFGISRLPGTGLTREPGVFRGTVPYATPEQVLGQPIEGRSDLGSLGRVLFECLHGSNPYDASTLEACMDRVLNLAPADLPALPGSTPLALSRLVHQMLQKDPADRPATARDVQREIARIFEIPREELVRLSGDSLVRPDRSAQAAPRPTRPLGPRRPRPRARLPWLVLPLVATFFLSRRPPLAQRPAPSTPVTSVTAPEPTGGSPILEWERHAALLDRLRAGGDTAHRAASWLSENTPFGLGPIPEFWLYWLEIARWLRTTSEPAPPPAPVASVENFQHMAETFITYDRLHAGLRYNAAVRYRAYKAFLWRAYQFPTAGRGWLGMGRILELEGEPDAARRVYRLAIRRMQERELVHEAPLVWQGMVRALERVPGRELERDWSRMITLYGGDLTAVDPWQALFDLLVESDRAKLERILRAAAPETPARAFLDALPRLSPSGGPR